MNRRGLGGIFQRGRIWWVQIKFRGQRYRESSHSPIRMDAVRLLRRRLAEMGAGTLHGPDQERTTFENLAAIIDQDYRANQLNSLPRMQRALKALRSSFGVVLARDITLDRLTAYVANRLEDGIAAATIKYELSVLRRSFRLAQRSGKALCPPFPILAVNNTRQGFFEHNQFVALRRHLPATLQPVITFAYITGWRTLSEILTLEWRQVDLKAKTVRLEPGMAKNKEGRVFPYANLLELGDLLTAQWEYTLEVQRQKGSIVPWVFHRAGRQIKEFRKAWHNACRLAGVPGRIPHDFRRTAVRNLERAGVSRSVAMKITGHKTESVYRRYAIVSEADISEGLKKLALLHTAETHSPVEIGHNSATILG